MTDLNIFGHHTKIFVFSASVFSIYTLLFFATSIVSYCILKPHREFTKTSESAGIVYAISCLLLQNHSVVYMLAIFLICFRLNLVNGALEKLVKNPGSDENVVKHLKAYASLIDKFCDMLQCIKIGYSIGIVIYIIQFFFSLILAIYSIIFILLSQDRTFADSSFILVIILWQLYFVPLVVWVFVVGYCVERENIKFEAFAQLLLIGKRSNSIIFKALEFISMQLASIGSCCGSCFARAFLTF